MALMVDRLLDAGFSRAGGAPDGGGQYASARGGAAAVRPPGYSVIGAHSADFVWRAGGAIAVTAAAGGVASVIALSYGERGESGELWKQEGQTVENVKGIRHAEAEAAAAGARRRVRVPRPGGLPAADRLRRAAADRRRDPRVRARRAGDAHRHRPVQPRPSGRLCGHREGARLAAGAGVPSAFATITPPALFLFEPHQPELCNFTPNTFVDITVGDRAQARGDGGDEGAALPADLLRPARDQRGNHARRGSGNAEISSPRRSSASSRRW